MKKFLVVFLLLFSVVSIVGCSDKPDEKKTKEDDTPVTKEESITEDDLIIFDPLPITFEENEETKTEDPPKTNESGNSGNSGNSGDSGNSDDSGNSGNITEITGGQTIETPLIPFK